MPRQKNNQQKPNQHTKKQSACSRLTRNSPATGTSSLWERVRTRQFAGNPVGLERTGAPPKSSQLGTSVGRTLTYTDRPVSYPRAPASWHTAAQKPGACSPPQLVLLVGWRPPSIHLTMWVMCVCERAGREHHALLRVPGCWEDLYRHLVLRLPPTPCAAGSPRAAVWTACVVTLTPQ